ncbi:hypothetical protein LT40_01165 [Pseudomonas rhizosphaerae]|jgi:hypothetical protein|uniref:Uncharacterized protein n=1 Tax=Pseudomonas rhizosphaerae TaxID=216142 RepID=A0A089YQW5_9PSED|nr:hypothetical protein LT40_01165 [Pseudomonas rhizosphaerae]
MGSVCSPARYLGVLLFFERLAFFGAFSSGLDGAADGVRVPSLTMVTGKGRGAALRAMGFLPDEGFSAR